MRAVAVLGFVAVLAAGCGGAQETARPNAATAPAATEAAAPGPAAEAPEPPPAADPPEPPPATEPPEPPATEPPAPQEAAPPRPSALDVLAGEPVAGERLAPAGLRGHTVFVNVWSSW